MYFSIIILVKEWKSVIESIVKYIGCIVSQFFFQRLFHKLMVKYQSGKSVDAVEEYTTPNRNCQSIWTHLVWVFYRWKGGAAWAKNLQETVQFTDRLKYVQPGGVHFT